LEGKLVSSGNETDITEICANALTAFSLVLSSGTGTEREAAPIEESADELTDELPGDSTNNATNKPALSVLKQDEFSLVVKVRCASNFYVLKRVNSKSYFATEETAAVQNSLMQFAGSERLGTEDGKYIFHEKLPDDNNAVWTLSRFIPNAPSFNWLDLSPSWTCAHSHSAGEILARLHHKSHEVSANLNAATSSNLILAISAIPGWLEDAFAKPFSKNVYGQTEDAVSIVDRSLILEKIRRCIVSVQSLRSNTGEQHQIIPCGEQIMIHGDFQPGNVLFLQDQVVGLIDWDYAHLDSPLLEVAYGMIMFSAKFAVPGDEVEYLDRALANAFLQGYSSGCISTGWSVYRAVAEPSAGASHREIEVECNVDDLHVLLPAYIKFAASLILLWALSKQGPKPEHRTTVLRKAVHFILSERNLFTPEKSSSDSSISQPAPHDNGAS
jgi:hypothetical protein